MFPLMKSRKGEIVCVGCGPVNQKKEESPQKVVSEETKVETVEKKVEKVLERSPEKSKVEIEQSFYMEYSQSEKIVPKVDNYTRTPVQQEKVVEKRAESPKEEKIKTKVKVDTQEVFEVNKM